MANKVVQLIDNDGDNIFPVAGSLAQGSITTSSINDGAVTADKIDFTTFGTPSYENITISCNRGGSINGTKITFTNGLIAVVGKGQVYSTSSSGVTEHQINWDSNTFTTMLGANLNVGIRGDTSSFMTYCTFTNNGCEFYINKVTNVDRLNISLIAIGF